MTRRQSNLLLWVLLTLFAVVSPDAAALLLVASVLAWLTLSFVLWVLDS